MDRERLEKLRKNLENETYIQNACEEIGSDIAKTWEDTGYADTNPSKEELALLEPLKTEKEREKRIQLLQQKPLVEVAKELNLPIKSLRDWCKRHNISYIRYKAGNLDMNRVKEFIQIALKQTDCTFCNNYGVNAEFCNKDCMNITLKLLGGHNANSI